LTLPAFAVGIACSTLAGGWRGAREALLGAGLGLLVLLPFVLIRSLGAGDWKLIGAMGAFLGPERLLSVLFATVLIAGIMAVILIIWRRRVGQTLRNIGRMLAAMLTLHLPGQDLSLDNPGALKIPFGLAAAVAAILYAALGVKRGI
jgi:prepilin peptidase CpaA